MILGEEKREAIEKEYGDVLTLIQDIEQASKEEIKAQADVTSLYNSVANLNTFKEQLGEARGFIDPDKYEMLMKNLDATLGQFNKALTDKVKAKQKAERTKPTSTRQQSVVSTPIQQPAKIKPEIVAPVETESEKKAAPEKKFVTFVPIEEEVEEEKTPQPSVIVPETLQGPTEQDKLREALMAILKDIESAKSEEQAEKLTRTLEAIDMSLVAKKDEGNKALLLQAQNLLQQKRSELEAQKITKRLNAFIVSLRNATQSVNAAATIEENQMITEKILNEVLAQYTDAQKLVSEAVYSVLTAQLTEALKKYCIALVPKVLLDATVDETSTFTIRTLHESAFSKLQDIDAWGTVPTTILESEASQLLVYTLNRIKNANILIALDELDIVLAALCASFDACMAALYNSKTVASVITEKLDIELYFELLNKVIQAFSKDFSYIDIFIKQYGDYCTTTVRDGYNADNFDITTKLNGLSAVSAPEQPEAEQPEQAAKYIYAVAKDTEVNFGTFSVKVEKPISPEHKKDYENIPTQWEKRVSAHQTFADITKKMEGPQPSTQELTKYLTELENLRDRISDTELDALKESLETNRDKLTVAKAELDALFAAFIQKIEEATGLLEDKKITVVNFNAPYIEAKRLIAQHAELAATYDPQLANLVSIYKKYITQALDTMIEATGLDTLHQRIFNKSAQVEAARTFSLNPDMNRALADMLNQLKQNALFGVDSTVDYQQPESKLLQKALFTGYAYILVAYDAAEASLYDGFSAVETITNWARAKTLYDSAIETMTDVVERIEELRGIYYREFLEPFFTDPSSHIAMPGSYLALYDKGDLSVLEFGLKDITDDRGYIYRRNGIPEIYKNASFSVLPIDALHRKDYKQRAKNWIKYTQRSV